MCSSLLSLRQRLQCGGGNSMHGLLGKTASNVELGKHDPITDCAVNDALQLLHLNWMF